MSRPRIIYFAIAAMWLSMIIHSHEIHAQSFGVELHNTVMPASGAMGGVSVAEPQDLLSAINGNPATISQFRGTQFAFGGVWVEPTVNLAQTGNGILPGIGPFAAKSGTPGLALGNIGLTQDFRVKGLPVTMGMALISTAGLGVDYAKVSNSNNSAMTLQVLTLQPGFGVQLSDRLSVGANIGLGIGMFDGLFTGISKSTPDYGIRGTVGMDFDVNSRTKFGVYYQSKESFTFSDAVTLQPFAGPFGSPIDIDLDLPSNVAIGVSNSSLAGGRLLLATDIIYKFWEDAALFDAVYDNQLAVQLGAQYTTQRAKLRIGYVWAEDAMVDVPGNVIDGITPPGGARAIQYIQGLAPNFNQHRFSTGIGVPNVLPGIDLNLFGGGMFRSSATFGRTSASVESYYVGGGLTWRFRRGSGCKIAPDEWCSASACYCGE